MQVIDSYEGCCRQMAKTRCLVSNSGKHRGHDHALTARLTCAECGEPVDARSGEIEASPRARRERAAFAAAQKAGSRPA